MNAVGHILTSGSKSSSMRNDMVDRQKTATIESIQGIGIYCSSNLIFNI